MKDHTNYVVIPCKNRWELTNRLLIDLARYEAPNIDKIIVVDDGSTDPEVSEGLGTWIDQGFPLEVLRNDESIGFTLTANLGLMKASARLAEKRLIFLISNDVLINGKFIEQAEEILFSAKRHFVGNRHVNWDSGWNKFDGVLFDYLEGYFLAATSDAWRDIGYFDPTYAPYDYEDVDISTKAKVKGYKLVSLNNPNIIHLGAQTYGYTEERRKQTERNRDVFRKKWRGL